MYACLLQLSGTCNVHVVARSNYEGVKATRAEVGLAEDWAITMPSNLTEVSHVISFSQRDLVH